MKKKKRVWLWALVALISAVVVFLVISRRDRYETQINSEECKAGVIETTVTATGEIQPVNKVTVGTQVSGIVEHLYVDFNSEVKKGQLLAELDKSTLREQVKQSHANLSTSQSNKQLAQKSFDRIKSLYEKKAATQEEYDQAESSLQQATNQLVTAKSNYENALTNLKYAEIYSPISGVVINKEVEEGQTVAASFSTPELFTIANDLTQMQVEADVDEADIGQVKVGQPVRFTVDAFPSDTFSGTVKQIRLEPTVTNNVVTYTVIIDAPNPESKLYPGMTANVSIIVQTEQGTLIPVEATYLQINEEQKALLNKAGYTLTSLPKHKDKGHNHAWVVNGKKLTETELTTGLDDGANIVVQKGIAEKDRVVLSVNRVKKSSSKEGNASDNPFMMGPPERKKR